MKGYGAVEAFQAFRLARDIPQKADILRLAVLAFEGGFFVDADDRCLKPLAGYIPRSATSPGRERRSQRSSKPLPSAGWWRQKV